MSAGTRGVELAEKLGSPYSHAASYLRLGIALAMAEKWPEALETLEHGLATARERSTCLETAPRFLAWLAEAAQATGDPERARSLSGEAVEAARRVRSPYETTFALLARARVLRQQVGAAEAPAIREALLEAQAGVDESGARNLSPLILLERAEIARLCGARGIGSRELSRNLSLVLHRSGDPLAGRRLVLFL